MMVLDVLYQTFIVRFVVWQMYKNLSLIKIFYPFIKNFTPKVHKMSHLFVMDIWILFICTKFQLKHSNENTY